MSEIPRPNTAEEMAEIILDTKAITVDPDGGFEWHSGIWSPIYTDLRLLISSVDARTKTTDHLVSSIKNTTDYDLIAGTATAGIVWATEIADRLRYPMVYVRSSDKNHGKQNRVEGIVNPGDNTLVCEDTVSKAESSIDASLALRKKEAIVENILGIMSYKFEEAEENADKAGINIVTVTDFPTVLMIAEEGEYWKPNEVQTVKEWYRNYNGWRPKK